MLSAEECAYLVFGELYNKKELGYGSIDDAETFSPYMT